MFEKLPVEVLRLIIGYALDDEPTRLRAPLVSTSLERRASTKPPPCLLLVNKLFCREAADIFYSRAILEVTPDEAPDYLFDAHIPRHAKFDLAGYLARQHKFIPRHHLKCIKHAHVYKRPTAHQPVCAEAYEALLRWLVHNTAVQHISLDESLMNRLRRSRVNLCSAVDLVQSAPAPVSPRPVYIWSIRHRAYYEIHKAEAMNKILAPRSLPRLQVHLLSDNLQQDAMLDPRWDVRASDDLERRALSQVVGEFIDRLVLRDPVCQGSPQLPLTRFAPKETDGRKLYQVCYVIV